MKNAISNVWLLGMIVLFILMFSGYLAVSISYSKVFKIKNEMLTIIEKHDGITNKTGKSMESKVKSGTTVTGNFGTLQTINLFLLGSSYNTKGTCPAGYCGVDDLAYNKKVSYSKNKGKYYYCFRKEKMWGAENDAAYYDVVVFYKFNLPVIGDILTFEIDGKTSKISFPQDSIGQECV